MPAFRSRNVAQVQAIQWTGTNPADIEAWCAATIPPPAWPPPGKTEEEALANNAQPPTSNLTHPFRSSGDRGMVWVASGGCWADIPSGTWIVVSPDQVGFTVVDDVTFKAQYEPAQ